MGESSSSLRVLITAASPLLVLGRRSERVLFGDLSWAEFEPPHLAPSSHSDHPPFGQPVDIARWDRPRSRRAAVRSVDLKASNDEQIRASVAQGLHQLGEIMRNAAIAWLFMLTFSGVASAQVDSENFASRQAVIINNAEPNLVLSDFNFENRYSESSTRLITNLKWTNSGTKAITAFEVVLLYFDPFNQPIGLGGRWMITGHNSANWSPLGPGQSDGDGLIGFRDEKVFTAVAYVRAIRFEDGTVWYSNQAEIGAKVKAAIPTLSELPSLDPAPKAEDH